MTNKRVILILRGMYKKEEEEKKRMGEEKVGKVNGRDFFAIHFD